jgi:hypothetical protein
VAEDAARVRVFQRQVTGETPFMLMQSADVPDEKTIAADLAEGLKQPGRFDLVATVAGADGERADGIVPRRPSLCPRISPQCSKASGRGVQGAASSVWPSAANLLYYVTMMP